jgi:transcriptional regulator GlxA family with amidase domain
LRFGEPPGVEHVLFERRAFRAQSSAIGGVIGIAELAHGCQISVSRLSHLFKDEIGINVKNYRMDCRLQVAAVMLVSTDMPIKGIAYLAGYLSLFQLRARV